MPNDVHTGEPQVATETQPQTQAQPQLITPPQPAWEFPPPHPHPLAPGLVTNLVRRAITIMPSFGTGRSDNPSNTLFSAQNVPLSSGGITTTNVPRLFAIGTPSTWFAPTICAGYFRVKVTGTGAVTLVRIIGFDANSNEDNLAESDFTALQAASNVSITYTFPFLSDLDIIGIQFLIGAGAAATLNASMEVCATSGGS